MPEYEDAQYTADQLYIQDQTFFIKWYNCGSAPYFTVLQKEDTEFSRLPIPQCTPCYLLTPHPIAEEWLLFSTFPEQQAYLKKDFAHLVLYNLKQPHGNPSDWIWARKQTTVFLQTKQETSLLRFMLKTWTTQSLSSIRVQI